MRKLKLKHYLVLAGLIFVTAGAFYYVNRKADFFGAFIEILSTDTLKDTRPNLNTMFSELYSTKLGTSSVQSLITAGADVLGQATSTLATHTSAYNHTNYDTAYTRSVGTWTYPLQFSGGTASLAFGTTTSNTWASTQTFGAVAGISLDEIDSPATDTTWTMAANNLTMNFTTPSSGLELNATGAFSDHVLHIHQSIGNPEPGTAGLHIEFADTDPTGILIDMAGASTSQALTVASGATDLRGGLTTLKNASSTNMTLSATLWTLDMTGTGALTWGTNFLVNSTGQASTSALTVSGNIWGTLIGNVTGTASGNLTSASIDTIAELNAILTGEDVASTSAIMTASSDSTWTNHNSYPAACGANTWATTIGDTLTCSAITYAGITAMTSANFAGLISDETGSGLVVLQTSPTLITPNLGTASATSLTVSGSSYLSTIVSGTWNGTAIGAQYGGTGSTTLSGILKGNGTSAVLTATPGTDYESPAYKEIQICMAIDQATATDDSIPMFMAHRGATIKSLMCECSGTCTTAADFALKDNAGNRMTHGSSTCATTGVATPVAVTANNTLSIGETLMAEIVNSPSVGGNYIVCASSTIP